MLCKGVKCFISFEFRTEQNMKLRNLSNWTNILSEKERQLDKNRTGRANMNRAIEIYDEIYEKKQRDK